MLLYFVPCAFPFLAGIVRAAWRSVWGPFAGSFACVPLFSGFPICHLPLCLAGFLFIFLPTALWQFDARNWSFSFRSAAFRLHLSWPSRKTATMCLVAAEGNHNFNYADREINLPLIFRTHWLHTASGLMNANVRKNYGNIFDKAKGNKYSHGL